MGILKNQGLSWGKTDVGFGQWTPVFHVTCGILMWYNTATHRWSRWTHVSLLSFGPWKAQHTTFPPGTLWAGWARGTRLSRLPSGSLKTHGALIEPNRIQLHTEFFFHWIWSSISNHSVSIVSTVLPSLHPVQEHRVGPLHPEDTWWFDYQLHR